MIPVGQTRDAGQATAVEIIVGQKFPTFHRSDPYTPIHVTIRNRSDEWIQLKYNYFTLFDSGDRAYVIAPVDEVFNWIRYERWARYYGPHFPQPATQYVFREGKLKPHKEVQAIMFFHQATRYGHGTYKLVANIPENNRPLEFSFRLK